MRRKPFLRLVGASGAAGIAGALGMAATEKPEPPLDTAAAERALSAHRIARIEARQLQDRYPRSIGPNAKGKPVGGGGSYQVRVVTTDQGVAGWGMSHGAPEEMKPYIGARVSDLFGVERGMSDEVEKLDIVLHDLAARILGAPVWRMIGAAGPRAVPIYSGAVYMEDLMPKNNPRGVAAVVAACRQDYGAGYRAFKLKIGRGLNLMPREEGLRRDIEVVRAVRAAFPGCRILVDANNAYTVEEACEFVRGAAECDLYCIEEPFDEERDGLRRLRDAMAQAGCKALIMEGESRKEQARTPTRWGGYTQAFVDNLMALAQERLIDVINCDLGIVGFTRWRRLMPELKRLGMLASPHTWMWTPRPYYAAQLVAGAGCAASIEGIPGAAKGVDYSAYGFEDGELPMPDAVGFGLSLV